MINWNTVDLLDIVEEYATSQNIYSGLSHQDSRGPWIESEEQLSEKFDNGHEDWLHENRDDQPAIDQEFNGWTDMLCKDGTIHPEQYDKYMYVGKYAE